MLLTIEKLIYGGDGLARLPPDSGGRGKAVFLPFVLAQEKIEAALTEVKPGFARAQAQAIVEPSPHRVTPQCPYFAQCGGCHYQHSSYDHQLEIKQEILRENLRRIAKLELACDLQVHPSPPWHYRNRSRLQVLTRPAFAAGYFRLASHDVLPVEQCPISSHLINRGIAALWQAGRAGKTPEGILEIEFFANADDTRLLVEVICAPPARRAAVRAWAEDLRASLPQIAGVTALRQSQKGGHERLVSAGAPELIYQAKAASYRVTAGSFFQTNRFLIDELVRIVTAGRSGSLAVDLYAGVGLFSTALARNIRHIVSVESSQTSASDLKYNLPSNGRPVQAAADHYLAGLAAGAGSLSGSVKTGASSAEPLSVEAQGLAGNGSVLPHSHQAPDLVVVDPPRGGLGDRVSRLLATVGAPRITYVSCDPATLARDLVPLLAAGYRVEEAHLLDLFPQTYHLETVIQLAR